MIQNEEDNGDEWMVTFTLTQRLFIAMLFLSTVGLIALSMSIYNFIDSMFK